jgi:hypothetical protein
MENKKESFTPGPWIGKETMSADQGLVYSELDGRNVAVTYSNKDVRLVAAAPEMLAALQMVIETLAPHFFEMGIKKSFSEQVVIRAVGTAIHSAIGE